MTRLRRWWQRACGYTVPPVGVGGEDMKATRGWDW